VSVAYDGETGLDQARQMRPDLIILDVIMPGKDGFEVCEQIKADPSLAGVPVMMLTSLPNSVKTSGTPDSVPCTKGYIEKPVRPAELLREVSKLLRDVGEASSNDG